MEKKNWMKELFRPENKKARLQLFTTFMVGILLLLMSNIFFAPKDTEEEEPALAQQTPQQTEEKTTEEQLEQRLQALFSQMEGVGQVEVMVTMKNTTRSVLAQEEKTEASTQTEDGGKGSVKTTETNKAEYTVVMTEDSKGSRTPVVLQETMPEVEGIVILAEGGDQPQVVQKVSEAAQALLNVPAHKIAVLKMK